MPYIITTSEPFDATVHVHRPAFSRTAVATLDEARDAARGVIPHDITAAQDNALYGAILDLPESGGTIGPLPDGTVIEVRPTNTITCPGNEFHGPCGKPAHWRGGASLGSMYRDGAYECSDTVCWTMTTLAAFNAR